MNVLKGVVLKGLHFSIPVSEIKAEFFSLGPQVRNVTNVRSQVTKQPLPMFFVDLDPSPSNKKVYEIRYINNTVVTIELERKANNIVQCHMATQSLIVRNLLHV